MSTMMSKFLGFFLLTCATTMSGGALAAPQVVFDGAVAIGVKELSVHGWLYDARFVRTSYDASYAATPPTFYGNDAGAIAAVEALAPLLNQYSAFDIGDGAANFTTLMVPTYSGGPTLSIPMTYSSGKYVFLPLQKGGNWWAGVDDYFAAPNDVAPGSGAFVVFEAVRPVPEPSELAMMVAGLAFLARRCGRRAKSD